MYILLPVVVPPLSEIFHFVLRDGLISTQAAVDAASPFGFAVLAGLVGMFSNKAALKLQEVAESIFSPVGSTRGKDHVDPRPMTAKAETGKKSQDKKEG